MKTCVICFTESHDVSQCITCKPSGITCHACDKLWFRSGHNALRCIICKQLSKSNVRLDCMRINYHTIYKHEMYEWSKRICYVGYTSILMTIIYMATAVYNHTYENMAYWLYVFIFGYLVKVYGACPILGHPLKAYPQYNFAEWMYKKR